MKNYFEIGDRIIAIRSFGAIEKGDIGTIVKNWWNDDLFYNVKWDKYLNELIIGKECIISLSEYELDSI